jgi:hypothetical protein
VVVPLGFNFADVVDGDDCWVGVEVEAEHVRLVVSKRTGGDAEVSLPREVAAAVARAMCGDIPPQI